MSFRISWTPGALDQLAVALEWSRPQGEAIVNAMEWMAASGLSLGRRVGDTEEFYWPVPPLGVFYAIDAGTLEVVEIVDRRRRAARGPE